MQRLVSLLVLVYGMQAWGQTTIDLSRQSRNVDFSRAVSTRPVKTGTALPAVCTTGDLFFLEGNTAVLYACTTANMWTLQSSMSASGAGLLAQTAGGVVTRSLAAGSGLVLTNGDGQAGNPALAADFASNTDASAGLSTDKLMTPERTRQAYQAWNPFPAQLGKNRALMTTDGSSWLWSWKLIVPAAGTQYLSTSTVSIAADRSFVRIYPASSFTLAARPVIADGEDGQFLTIVNTSASSTLTFPDEALAAGSNLRLGGKNLDLGPRQSATLVFAAETGDWILIQGSSSAATAAGISGPAASIDGQLPVFDGDTGTRIRALALSGVVKAAGGVASVVAGNALDCVRVNGTAAPCVSDVTALVTGAASSVNGQLAAYSGTTGKTLGTVNLTGVLKASQGVPSTVAGNATDCVRVDGSAGPCGGAGALTITDYRWYATASSSTGTSAIAANGWTVPSSSATININGTNAVMVFADTGTPAGVFPLVIPPDWAGGPVSIRMQFTPTSSGCNSGEDLIWRIKTGAYAVNDTAMVYPTWSAAKTVTHVFPTTAANRLQSLVFTDLDVSSWSVGKRALIWFERDAAADTGTCIVNLLGVELGLRRTLQ